MSNDSHQQDIHKDLVQGLGVVDGGLVKLEDEEFIREVEEYEGDDRDGDEDGNDPAEGKCDEESSDHIGVSLTDRKDLITEVLDILTLRLSGGGHASASSIEALLDALLDGSDHELSNRGDDVENHSEDDNGSDALVPVRGEVIELPEEEEAHLAQIYRVLVVVVEKDHDQPHVHYQQKGTLEGVTDLLIDDSLVPFQLAHELEDVRDYHVVNHDAKRYQKRDGEVENVLSLPGGAVLAVLGERVEQALALADAGHIVGLDQQSSSYDSQLVRSIEYVTIYVVIVGGVEFCLLVLDVPKEQVAADTDNNGEYPADEDPNLGPAEPILPKDHIRNRRGFHLIHLVANMDLIPRAATLHNHRLYVLPSLDLVED